MKYFLGEHRVTTETEDYWIAPSASVIGKVILHDKASVWFGATLRGDNENIIIGERSNVQDNSVLHTDLGFPLSIGCNVSIGHMVMLHGCIIGDGTLVGIGSIILNGARIGENCLIGANSLITEGKKIPPNSLVMGAPGQIVREITAKDREGLAYASEHYVEQMQLYRERLAEDC